MYKCSDVMTKDPLFCLPSDRVVKVAEMMMKSDIGPVLIIENEQTRKLAGIVTDRDLALKIVAGERDPGTTTAEEVMTRKVITVNADDDVQTALDIMTDLQIRRVPVLGRDDRVVGILSQADVATRVDQPQKTAALVKGISQDRRASG